MQPAESGIPRVFIKTRGFSLVKQKPVNAVPFRCPPFFYASPFTVKEPEKMKEIKSVNVDV